MDEAARQIEKSATRARQGEKGPSMFVVLTLSTFGAIALLAVIWFVFLAT